MMLPRRRQLCLAAALLPLLPMAGRAAGQGGAVGPEGSVPGPSLDLLVTHRARVLTAEGVLRETRYQERILRRPGHIWSERILPPFAAHADETGHPHRTFNSVTTPRHLFLQDGTVQLEFIDRHARERIRLRRADWDSVGFDGSWARAWHLFDPAALARMTPQADASAAVEARWLARRENDVLQRVLWDEGRRVVREVETVSTDPARADFRLHMQVEVEARLAGVLPWAQLQGYAWREFADFLD